MKTALQKLMDDFDAYQLESGKDSITIEKMKEVIAKEYLKKEKEQIIEAYNEGWKNPAKFRENGSPYYYQNTFGDNTEVVGQIEQLCDLDIKTINVKHKFKNYKPNIIIEDI